MLVGDTLSRNDETLCLSNSQDLSLLILSVLSKHSLKCTSKGCLKVRTNLIVFYQRCLHIVSTSGFSHSTWSFHFPRTLGVQLVLMQSGKHIDCSPFRSDKKCQKTSVLPKLFFFTLETEFEVEGQEKMAHYHNDYKKVRPFSFWRREGSRQAYEKNFLN